MPANTPIFGFPYPLGTDPVSQGDNDIRALAEAVESGLGLWKITTCTVTSVGGTAATSTNGTINIGTGNTSITVNNAFSAQFDNYRIIFYGDSSTGTTSHQIGLNGITTSTYFSGGTFMSWGGTTITGFGPAASTTWIASANTVNATPTAMVIDLLSPFRSARTFGSVSAQAGNGHSVFQLQNSSAVSSGGFTVSKGGDTMTGGTIRVYGFRN
jgi:hypothetical protein